ncbi:hypothetical protein BS47DRAFT_1345572, partial [Hydnum rufescens UP504]
MRNLLFPECFRRRCEWRNKNEKSTTKRNESDRLRDRPEQNPCNIALMMTFVILSRPASFDQIRLLSFLSILRSLTSTEEFSPYGRQNCFLQETSRSRSVPRMHSKTMISYVRSTGSSRTYNRIPSSLARSKTTQSMISFDDFKFHCIPPLPRKWIPLLSLVISQLNLWAGQLYLRDHRTYMELCRFLGIVTAEDGSAHRAVQTDGFVFPEHRGAGTAMQTSCSFTESPIPFIARVVGLRRKGCLIYQVTSGSSLMHP